MAPRWMSSLPDILKSELEHDVAEGSQDMPDELVELKEFVEKSMTIEDIDGESVVKLHSTGSPKVVIEFDCRDSTTDEGDYDEELVEAMEEAGMETEGGSAVAFTADVEKGSDLLRFHCTASEVVNIDTVEYLPGGESGVADNAYTGPDFDELDEDLKNAFHEYLEDVGVTESLSNFIAMYSDHKEQQEYTRWLQNVQKFTE
eukprot:CAMPEP_0182537970 /NCGR_PEP_ID=MMETSP1323-20130603/22923_1 /TAXON_ID=236787 /ORGANISM="Florenciella parvula, Strain RCC1693" /LENGTH=201 /DNA_ID=CAMNT_0024748409 /DNA_START=21 /DNA_END=626 /DNA_ORIENTATION=+